MLKKLDSYTKRFRNIFYGNDKAGGILDKVVL